MPNLNCFTRNLTVKKIFRKKGVSIFVFLHIQVGILSDILLLLTSKYDIREHLGDSSRELMVIYLQNP